MFTIVYYIVLMYIILMYGHELINILLPREIFLNILLLDGIHFTLNFLFTCKWSQFNPLNNGLVWFCQLPFENKMTWS